MSSEFRAARCEVRRSELLAAFDEAGINTSGCDNDSDEFLLRTFQSLCAEGRVLGPIAANRNFPGSAVVFGRPAAEIGS